MNPAQKALWFIESHLAGELTLDEIAAIGGISRFHMVRAFAAATGLSVMRYVRARRLTRGGAGARGRRARYPQPGAGGGLRLSRSIHPRVPRPFRGHARNGPRSTCLDRLKLQEPIVMDSTAIDNLQAPRFETGKPFLVAGIGERYTCEQRRRAFPASGSAFTRSVDSIPGRIGKVAYGVCCNGDDAGNFDYIAGVEVVRLFRPAARVRTGPHPRTEIRGVFPPRAHLDHSPHRQHDLESLAAVVRPEGGRCAQLRAL